MLAFRKRVLPADHPDIGLSMSNLASTYSALGRHPEALKLQVEALAFFKRVLPADHPDIATSLSDLGTSFGHLRRFADAEENFKAALMVLIRNKYPPTHPTMNAIKTGLARVRSAAAPPATRAPAAAAAAAAAAPRAKKKAAKPNEKCPCGSGDKFKKCCGKLA